MKAITALLLLAALFVAPSEARAEYDNDSRLWSFLQLSQYKDGPVHVYSWAETRWQEDFTEMRTWWISEKLSIKLNPTWDATLAGTYLESRKGTDQPWRRLTRAEVELNPRMKLSDNWTARIRNRLEFRWWEDAMDSPDYVTRHRLYFNAKNVGPDWMKTFAISNEIFYDWEDQRFVENRFYPVTVKVGKGPQPLGFFLGFRSRRVSDHSWDSWAVIGAGWHASLPTAR